MGFNLEDNVIEDIAIPHFKSLGYDIKVSEKEAFNELIITRGENKKKVSVRSTYNKQHSGKYALNIMHDIRGGLFDFNRKESDLILAYIVPEKRTEVIPVKDLRKSDVSVLYI